VPRGRSLPIWFALKWAIALLGWPVMIPGMLLFLAFDECDNREAWARITRDCWRRQEAARAPAHDGATHPA
jgi:hypothetical protein